MTPKTETKTRNRRSPDQMVADLEAEIARVKARAAAREAKSTEEGKALLLAVKFVDKALTVAAEANNADLLRGLEAARAPLSEQVVAMGIRLPDSKAKRGRKRKGEAVGADLRSTGTLGRRGRAGVQSPLAGNGGRLASRSPASWTWGGSPVGGVAFA